MLGITIPRHANPAGMTAWAQAIAEVSWTTWVRIAHLLAVTCLFLANVPLARDVTLFLLTMLCVFIF
jgi:hypothetical protein